jgi:hypothetical protein
MTSQNASYLTSQKTRDSADLRRSIHSTWRYAASRGAALCVVLAILYALAFLVYALIRSAFTVLSIDNPDAGRVSTLIATWASLFVAVLAITIILAILVAILGAVTGIIINALSSFLNPEHVPQRAVGIGIAVCLGIVVLLHLALRSAMNFSLPDLLSEHALFWLELPSLIFVVAGGAASARLTRPQ